MFARELVLRQVALRVAQPHVLMLGNRWALRVHMAGNDTAIPKLPFACGYAMDND
jgi:hypothetical protein